MISITYQCQIIFILVAPVLLHTFNQHQYEQHQQKQQEKSPALILKPLNIIAFYTTKYSKSLNSSRNVLNNQYHHYQFIQSVKPNELTIEQKLENKGYDIMNDKTFNNRQHFINQYKNKKHWKLKQNKFRQLKSIYSTVHQPSPPHFNNIYSSLIANNPTILNSQIYIPIAQQYNNGKNQYQQQFKLPNWQDWFIKPKPVTIVLTGPPRVWVEGTESKFPPILEHILERIQSYFSIYKYADTSRPIYNDDNDDTGDVINKLQSQVYNNNKITAIKTSILRPTSTYPHKGLHMAVFNVSTSLMNEVQVNYNKSFENNNNTTIQMNNSSTITKTDDKNIDYSKENGHGGIEIENENSDSHSNTINSTEIVPIPIKAVAPFDETFIHIDHDEYDDEYPY